MNQASSIPPFESGFLLDALRGDTPPPSELIGRAAQISRDPEWRCAVLRAAAISDQHEAMTSLIEQGFDPLFEDGLCLVLAAHYGSTRTVEALLRAGVPAAIQDHEAFVVAAAAGSVSTFNALLAFGGDLETRVLHPSLLAALASGRVPMVQRLLEIYPLLPEDSWTEVVDSALLPRGHVAFELLRIIKNHGCTDALLSQIMLPAAAWYGHVDAVNWILSLKPDLTVDDYAALRCAANGESNQCFDLVSEAMFAQNMLSSRTLEVLRAKGLEAYATLLEMNAASRNYDLVLAG